MKVVLIMFEELMVIATMEKDKGNIATPELNMFSQV